jgi:PKD repeat protein
MRKFTRLLYVLLLLLIATLLQAQPDKIIFSGLVSTNEGLALWNADGTGAEAAMTGHALPQPPASWANAFYYCATRDYNKMDNLSTAGMHGQSDSLVGFTNTKNALTAAGLVFANLRIAFTLSNLGTDAYGTDWDILDNLENRNYRGGYLKILLKDELILAAPINTLNLNVLHKSMTNDSIFGATNYLSPANMSGTASAAAQAVAQAFLQDIAGHGFRIEFAKIKPTASPAFMANGRNGANYDILRARLVKGTSTLSNVQTLILPLDRNPNAVEGCGFGWIEHGAVISTKAVLYEHCIANQIDTALSLAGTNLIINVKNLPGKVKAARLWCDPIQQIDNVKLSLLKDSVNEISHVFNLSAQTENELLTLQSTTSDTVKYISIYAKEAKIYRLELDLENAGTRLYPEFSFQTYTGDRWVYFQDMSSAAFTEIVNWQWDFNNDGVIDYTGQNPSWEFAQSGYYTVKLTVSDNLKSASVTKIVKVQGPCDVAIKDVSISYPTTSISKDGKISVAASGGLPPYTFRWTKNDTIVGTSSDVLNLPKGNYVVTVWAGEGCSVSKTYDLHLASECLIYGNIYREGMSENCDSTRLYASTGGSQGMYQYQWSIGSEFNKTTTENMVLAKLSIGQKDACVVISDINNPTCKDTACTKFEVFPPISFSLSTPTVLVNRVKISPITSGGSGMYSINWSYGDGSWQNANSEVSHVYMEARSYEITAEIVDNKTQCRQTASKIVDIKSLGTCEIQGYIQQYMMQVNDCYTQQFQANLPFDRSAYKYLWDFGDGKILKDTFETIHVFPDVGTYTVKFKIWSRLDSAGCHDVFSKTVTIKKPQGDFSINNLGGNVYQFVSTVGQEFNVNWTIDNEQTSEMYGNSPKKFFLKAGTHAVCMKIANYELGYNCYNLICKTLTVASDYKCALKFDSISVKQLSYAGAKDGAIAIFTSGSVGYTEYMWDQGFNGNQVSSLGSGLYHLLIKDEIGCSLDTSIVIKDLYNKCQFYHQIEEKPSDCRTFTLTANIFHDNQPFTTAWTMNGKKVGDQNVLNYTFPASGTYTGCFTSKDVADTTCKITDCRIFKINDIKASFTLVQDKNKVTLTPNISNADANTSLHWDLGDDFTTEGTAAFSHFYFRQGKFTIRLKAMDNNNQSCFAEASQTIDVTEIGICNLTAYINQINPTSCNSYSFNSMISSNGLEYGYNWDFGDGSPKMWNQGYVDHSFTKDGTFNVKLYTWSLSDSAGCHDIYTLPINIQKPQGDFTISKISDNVYHFEATGLEANSNFYWEFGNGHQIWQEFKTTQMFQNAGTYSICLNIEKWMGGNQCKNTVCKQVVITRDYQCNLKFDQIITRNATNAAGDDGYANVTVTGGTAPYNFWWSNMQNSPEQLNLKSGMYRVEVQDQYGCHIDTSLVIYDNIHTCQAYMDVNAKGVNCNEYWFAAKVYNNNRPYNIKWVFNDKIISTKPEFNYTFPTPGMYTGCIIVTDVEDTSCVTKDCGQIYIGQPTLAITKVQKQNRLTVTPTVGGVDNDYDLKFDFGDGQVFEQKEAISHIYSQPGKYFFKAKLTPKDNDACFAEVNETINVTEISNCNLFANIGEAYLDSGCRRYQLRANLNNPTSEIGIKWDFGDGSTVIYNNSPYHIYAKDGDYKVKLYIWLRTDSANCNAEAYKLVTVKTPVANIGLEYLSSNLVKLTNLATSQNDDVFYSWDFGDATGSEFNNITTTHEYTKMGIYNACLKVYSRQGNDCYVKTCKPIVVKDISVCNMQIDSLISTDVRTIGGSDGSAKIFVSGGKGSYTYLWNTGAKTQAITGLKPGFYKVVVSDTMNCRIEASVQIMQPLSKCPLSIEVKEIPLDCNTRTYIASVYNNGKPYSIEWNINGKVIKDSLKFTYRFAQTGTYYGQVTVRDKADTSCHITEKGVIKVFTPVMGSFTKTISTQNLNRVKFAPTFTGGSGSYLVQWNMGDQNTLYSSAPFEYSYKAVGKYLITMFVRDTLNEKCSFIYKDSVNITAVSGCGIMAYYKPQTSGECMKFNFEAFVDNGGKEFKTYWIMGDGKYYTNLKFVGHTFEKTGEYPVTLIVKDLADTTCMAKYVTMVKVVAPVSEFIYKYVNDTTVEFNAPALAAGSYLKWDFGDYSFDENKLAVTHAYKNYQANYKVSLTVSSTDNNACATTTSKYIVIPKPVVCNLKVEKLYIRNATGTGKNDGAVVVTHSGGVAPYTYSWSNQATTRDITGLAPGKYYLEIKDAQGCMINDSAEIKVETLACNIIADFKIEKASGDCNKYLFNAIVNNGDRPYKVKWGFTDGINIADKLTIDHRFQTMTARQYDVYFYVWDAADSANCHLLVKKTINVQPVYAYFDVSITKNVVDFIPKVAGATNYSVKWNFGDGMEGYDTMAVKHAYYKAGTYSVCLNVLGDCPVTYCKEFTINRIDSCDIMANFALRLDSLSGTLFVQNASTQNLKYKWDFGDGTYSADFLPIPHLFQSPGYYNICLTVFNPTNNCQKQICQSVYVSKGKCVADFSFVSDSTLSTIRFTDASIGNPTKYYWTFGDGYSSDQKNPVHTFARAGIYKVCHYVQDVNGLCQAEICKKVKAGGMSLIANFSTYVDKNNLVYFTDNSSGMVTNWMWSFGDGMYSKDQNAKHTYIKGGVYNVCLSVKDSINKLNATACQPVQINNSDTVMLRADYGFFVDNATKTVKFSDKSRGNITNWYWKFGDGKMDTIQNPSHVYTKGGSYEVCLMIYNKVNKDQSNFCQKVDVIEANQILLAANFSYFVDPVTNKVTFTNQSVGNVSALYWDFGDGETSADQNPVHTFKSAGLYNVCLKIYDADKGIASDKCVQVQINTDMQVAPLIANFSFFVNAATNQVFFKDRSLGSPSAWYWSFGDNNIDTVASPVHTFLKGGVYNICLKVYNKTTRKFAEYCEKITITTKETVVCNADFMYFTDQSTTKVNFTDKSTGNISKWYWTMGDGAIVTEQNPVYTYARGGVYNVCLNVWDATTGSLSKKCQEVKVGSAVCNLVAKFSQFIDMKANKVSFSDQSTGNTHTCFWTFGDGGTSAATNPVYTYQKAGYYLVTLSVFNKDLLCTDRASALIQVGTVECVADFEAAVTDVDKLKVEFTNTSKGDLDYYWSFGDGNYTKEMNPIVNFEKPGIYYVGLTVINKSGLCKDQIVKPIQVGKVDCSAQFTYYVDSLSNTVYFNNKALGEQTALLWMFGDGAYSKDNNPVHKFEKPGYYKVGLTTYNKAFGCMDNFSTVILIGKEGNDMEADFAYQVDDATRIVKFFDKSMGQNRKYIWNFGDNEISYSADITHTYAADGFKNVCLTVYREGTIYKHTKCQTIKVGTLDRTNCMAKFVFTVDSVSKTATFVNHSYGKPDLLIWKYGDGVSDNAIKDSITHKYAASNYYLVSLTIQNSTTGCKSTALALLNIAMGNKGLRAGFTSVVLPAKKGKGHPVDFVGTSLGEPASVKWTFGDGKADTTTVSPTHVYETPGTYTVCFTVADPVTGVKNSSCQVITITAFNEFEDLNAHLDVYPNPFRSETSIDYTLLSATKVDLSICDILGRKIVQLVNNKQETGTYTIKWNRTDLKPGIYLLHFRTSQGVAIRKMIISD